MITAVAVNVGRTFSELLTSKQFLAGCGLVALGLGGIPSHVANAQSSISMFSLDPATDSPGCVMQTGELQATWVHFPGGNDVLRGVLKTGSSSMFAVEAELVEGVREGSGALAGFLFELDAQGQPVDGIADAWLVGGWKAEDNLAGVRTRGLFEALAVGTGGGSFQKNKPLGEISGVMGMVGYSSNDGLVLRTAISSNSKSLGLKSLEPTSGGGQVLIDDGDFEVGVFLGHSGASKLGGTPGLSAPQPRTGVIIIDYLPDGWVDPNSSSFSPGMTTHGSGGSAGSGPSAPSLPGDIWLGSSRGIWLLCMN